MDALRGKEKLRFLEERLAGFRQEPTLHITVNLSSLIDVLNFQRTESFKALDDATKEGAQKTLEAVSGNRTHWVAATDAQTKQMRALHTQTEMIVSREFESEAASLAEQSEVTHALTVRTAKDPDGGSQGRRRCSFRL